MRLNYLNNKDILKEIHKSKISYCSFPNPADSEYDLIISDLKQINKKNIKAAREARAARLAKLAYEASQAAGEKRKLDDFEIKPSKIPITDVVFRVMTWDHIPIDDIKQRKQEEAWGEKETEYGDDGLEIKMPNKYVKVNFPPFQHYKIDEKGTPYCVGKSHWKGPLDTGKFSKDHGKMTNKLATMFIKLCERYATRSNWRGYCVDIETEALTQRGWLKESEITTNDKILSYDGSRMIWSDIRSIFRDQFDGQMFKMTSRGVDALMTPGHKIVTEAGLVPVELLKETDKIIIMGKEIADQDPIYPDSLIELIGWIVTKGNYQPKKKIVTIYQNEGEKAERIRNCLNNLGYEFTEKHSIKSTNIAFSIKRKHWDNIIEIIPDKNLTMNLILSLSNHQKHLLIETMIDANGHRHGLLKRYTQKDKTHIDLFQALLALTGQKMNIHFVENKMSFGKPVDYYVGNIFSKRGNKTRGESVNLHGGKNNGRSHPGLGKIAHPNFPTVRFKGTVWCPETEYGCFLARRNGKPYLTGNTYNDEMRSQALLQLSQIGLQFDESKSQNPFAYYTAAITNSFTRVLNIEKRHQNLRDDILEMNNYNPSYTRQNMFGGNSGSEE